MNQTPLTQVASGLTADLNDFLHLCEEILALARSENQSLSGRANYELPEFCARRKDLLPRLDSALIKLRSCRQSGQMNRPTAPSAELKTLFQAIQNLLMKILLLDRENQQALLRRGLVPASHLPVAASQQPHYVAGLYRRHTVV